MDSETLITCYDVIFEETGWHRVWAEQTDPSSSIATTEANVLTINPTDMEIATVEPNAIVLAVATATLQV